MYKKSVEKIVSPSVPYMVGIRRALKRKRLMIENEPEIDSTEPVKKKRCLSDLSIPTIHLLHDRNVSKTNEKLPFISVPINGGSWFRKYVFVHPHNRVVDKTSSPVYINKPNLTFYSRSSVPSKQQSSSDGKKKRRPGKHKKDPFEREYDKKSKKRTIIANNIDSGTCEEWTRFFEQIGEVDLFKGETSKPKKSSVYEENRESSFSCFRDENPDNSENDMKSGFCIFSSSDALSSLKSGKLDESRIQPELIPPPRGLLKNIFNRECIREIDNLSEYRSSIVKWLEEYDIRKRKEKNILRTVKNKTDADGWTFIVPKDPEKVGSFKNVNISNEGKSSWAKRRRKKKERRRKEKENFALYEFQRVERKKEKLRSLKQKFEDDLKKINEMKEKRKFQIV